MKHGKNGRCSLVSTETWEWCCQILQEACSSNATICLPQLFFEICYRSLANGDYFPSSREVGYSRSLPAVTQHGCWLHIPPSVTMYHKGIAAESAPQLFYMEIEFTSVTYFQSCEMQAKAYRWNDETQSM